MHSNFNWTVLFIGLALAAACNSTADDDKTAREFALLDAQLTQLAAVDETRWLDKLDEIKSLSFTVPAISNLQKTCVLAYDNYGTALARLSEVKKQIRALKEAIKQKNTTTALALHDQAVKQVERTNQVLQAAEQQVSICQKERQKRRNGWK